MPYRTLPHLVGGLVLTLALTPLSTSQAQDEGAPDLLETLSTETTTNVGVAELATDRLDQPTATNQVVESVAPPARTEPPPPHVIQVQLPTMPVLAREDIDLLIGRLSAIEQRMANQQDSAMAMVAGSNHTVLTVAAILGGIGLLGIVGASIILVRAFNRFSDVMLTLPMGHQLGRGLTLNSLAIDELHPAAPNALEQVSARFLGALEQLEKRIRELESESGPDNPSTASPGNGSTRTHSNPSPTITVANAGENGPHPAISAADNSKTDSETANENRKKIQKLLGEGESLFQEDKFEEALIRFDAALAIESHNSDALIKRGMTLERLQRMDAAIESYDRAIATNGSLTLAYLHKGAICNRLQRYREALECYERALQAEQKV